MKHVGPVDQRVPVGGIDISADRARRIDLRIAQRDDFALQPHLHARERHVGRAREFQFEIVEASAKRRILAQMRDQRVDGVPGACDGGVDAFMGKQDRAPDALLRTECAQGFAQGGKIRQCGKLVEGGDLEGHRGGLAGCMKAGKVACPGSAGRLVAALVPNRARDKKAICPPSSAMA